MSLEFHDPTLPERLPAPIAWRAADLLHGSDSRHPWLEGIYFAESVFRFVALVIKAAYLELFYTLVVTRADERLEDHGVQEGVDKHKVT